MDKSKLNKLYTKKQIEALKCFKKLFWILIQHGAKRAGKTVSNNDLFLLELKRVRKIADTLKIPEPQYILAGNSLGSLARNVLIEITNKYGIDFKFNKYNEFKLFGVKVCCFGHGTIRDMARIRGMTAFGAYINEATTGVEEVIREILNRCSGEGARVMMDTNPDHPQHYIKTDYIDKADGEKIIQIHYELDDNDFLPAVYKENIKLTTPSGMFYDRDIKGMWVNSEGMVYKDYNSRIHLIDKIPDDEEIIEYIIAVDWGFEHYGSLGVIGYSTKGNYYLIEEHTKKHMYVEDYWLKLALEKKEQYKICIGFEEEKLPDGTPKPKYRYPIFYVDSARQEYRNLFIDNNIEAMNANKSVIEGIQTVGTLFKTNKLFILKDGVDRFEIEINSYVWSSQVGAEEKVKKVNDDCMDMIRYAVHSHKTQGEGIRLGGDYN